jgi:hypothetical protein
MEDHPGRLIIEVEPRPLGGKKSRLTPDGLKGTVPSPPFRSYPKLARQR